MNLPNTKIIKSMFSYVGDTQLTMVSTIDEMLDNIITKIYLHNTKLYDPHYLRKHTYYFDFGIYESKLNNYQPNNITDKIICANYFDKYQSNIKVNYYSINTRIISENDYITYFTGAPIFPIITILLAITMNSFLWVFYKNRWVDPDIKHFYINIESELS
jgi:hypothetical protein